MNRRMFVIVALALAGGLLVLLAIRYVMSSHPIDVVAAEYGVPGRTCDAGPAFKKAVGAACNGFRPRCLITVSSAWCGDPAPGALKTLTVDYRCGATLKRATGTDLTGITVACP
jgi:hypothetical protein